MNSETKICQNCKQNFTIEPEDFKFYEKISVPPPTWCPECRMVRRMAWRNERSLYRRKCDAPGHSEDIVAIYPQNEVYKVFDREFWWSDKWNAMDYSKGYNFTKPFFQQFKELLDSVPRVNVFNTNAINSEYGNHNEESKDCYLLFASIWNEKVSYSRGAVHSKDSFDVLESEKCELCYNISYGIGCFNVASSEHATGSNHSTFLYNCRNCSDCFGCINLRNRKNCFFNEQLSKDEYNKKIKELDLGSYKTYSEISEKFEKLKLGYVRQFGHFINAVNVIGDNVGNTKNCYYCFDVYEGAEDCRYVAHGGWNLKDTFDGYGLGLGDLMYEVIDTGIATSRVKFVVVSRSGHDVIYGFNCHSSSNLFACIGLRNKSYCILNKQYTKEEYESLVPKIIKHMNDMPYIDKKGRVYKYGEFFPPELSPFSYNETIAQEYFPLTKEEAIKQGYSWKDPEPRNYQITLKTEDISDHIKDIKDSVLDEIIQCAHHELGNSVSKCNEQCTEAFRIIPTELAFLRKQNLPIPRLCPNCRHYQRIKQRNPLKLWHRQCQCNGAKSSNSIYTNTAKHDHSDSSCSNEFETSYAPDRPEIVYCERCYLREVV